MPRRSPRSALPELILALALGLASAQAAAESAGQVTHLSGTLSAKRSDGSSTLLSVGSEVREGDELTTQRETYARIRFADRGEVVLRPESALKVERFAYDAQKPETDGVLFGLIRGGLRAVTGLIGKRNKDAYKVRTATATIGIRGTHFGLLMCADDCFGVPTVSGSAPANGLHVDVVSGAVVVSNGGGEQIVGAGQFGFVRDAVTPPVLQPPQEGVRVTMPQAISQNNAGGGGVGRSDQTQCSVQ